MKYNKNNKMRFRLWQRRGFWAAVSSLVALCLAVSAVPSALAQPSVVVDIAVVPASKTVPAYETFALDIYVYPNGQEVTTVDALMTFHPAYLEVLSITGDPSGLDQEIKSEWDNTAGTLKHGRGKWSAPFPDSEFRLCSIELRAKAATAGTPLAFTVGTDATEPTVGLSVLRNTTDGTVVITPVPVGGVGYLADPGRILAPWVGLIAMTGLILVAGVVFLKKARRGV